MTGNEAVAVMIDALEACGIDYMLVGSYSSNYYGIARATKDADFVLQLEDGEREVWLPKAEDVIVMKLRWCRGGNRSKDFQDSLDVAAVQGDALDWDYLRGWCGKHGTLELLEEIREETKDL